MFLINGIFDLKSFPLNKIYLSRDRLIGNYQYLSRLHPKIAVAPVLKSNAYGHGASHIAKILDQQKLPFFCVDSLYEAYQLQKAGVKKEILIMGYIDPRSLSSRKLPFSYAVFDIDQLNAINHYQPGAKIHLFFDTGMHREGLSIPDFYSYIRQTKSPLKVKVDGVMSHLAIAGNPLDPITKSQIANFKGAKKMIRELGYKPSWFHLGGSQGLLNSLNTHCNLIRSGLSLYGLSTLKGKHTAYLQPVLRFTSRIAQIKSVPKGEYIGYGKKFQAPRDLLIAILPIGYNDGLDKRLSNKGRVFYLNDNLRRSSGGTLGSSSKSGYTRISCSIVGEISMNITTIDITPVKNALKVKLPAVGDKVEIFSDNPLSPNSIQNTAKICNTAPYDILVHLNNSTKREVV